jgi:glycosyltransferase involved in cell wall biosynthesis
MRIALLASHEVAEYDDVRMFTQMGHEVFCPGGYQNPREHTGIRPAIPDAPVFPELIEACERVRREKGDPGPMIDWAKAALPDEVIDWADIIIAHHFVDRWLGGQWGRIKHKRVVWRTCGQSNADLEAFMAGGRAEGLQIVRYSPKERNLPNYAGEDAVIRFGKDPAEWYGWTGENEAVGNITQNMRQRGDACGYGFWQAATEGLKVRPAGPGSLSMRGGFGELSYEAMQLYLRLIRCYLYTGTQPASYTLGLIEAMMTGVPVVSIGPKAFGGDSYVAELFEGHEITMRFSDDPQDAQRALRVALDNIDSAQFISAKTRQTAIGLFGLDKIKAEWAEFLR